MEKNRNTRTDMNWTFSSVANWGESPEGIWTLKFNPDQGARFARWSLTIYGETHAPGHDVPDHFGRPYAPEN